MIVSIGNTFMWFPFGLSDVFGRSVQDRSILTQLVECDPDRFFSRQKWVNGAGLLDALSMVKGGACNGQMPVMGAP